MTPKNHALVIAFLLLSTIAGAQSDTRMNDWANFAKYEKANKTAPMGAKAVFMGNSITEGWAANSPDFFIENNYIGRGISGQVTSQMLVRFRNDVVALQPRTVVILAGTNDIARNNGYITLQNILGNIISMCEIAKEHGIKVILCSVLPAYEYLWFPEVKPAGEIVKLNGMLKEYAMKENITYVDFHAAMRDEKDGLPKKYASDGVHPTMEGYKLMEKIIKPVIDKVSSR